MELPRIEIREDDSIEKASARLEQAFAKAGAELGSFEFNNALPCANHCRFFHVALDGREAILVVSTGGWDEDTTIRVLNVLLELRLDPDPPGSRPRVEFYSSTPVPDILRLLFSDSPIGELECRACLVARFGHDLEPAACEQLAAAARFLIRDLFGVDLSPADESFFELWLGEVERLRAAQVAAEPLNALIALGCLLGEGLRAELDRPSGWAAIRQFEPWPALLFAPPARSRASRSGEEAAPRAESDVETTADQVAFSPIAHAIHFYHRGERNAFRRAVAELKLKCG